MEPSKPIPYVDRNTGMQRTRCQKDGWRLRVINERSGRQSERTFYGTYEAACTEIDAFRAEVNRQGVDAQQAGKTLTVGEFFPVWLSQLKWVVPPSAKQAGVPRKHSTWRRHYDQSLVLIPALGHDTRIRMLTHAECVEAVASLTVKKTGEAMKTSSKETAARTMKAAFKWGLAEGYLTVNPAAAMPSVWGIEGPRARTVIPSLVELESMATYLDAWTDDDVRSEIFGDVTRVLAYTGLRWSELVGLLVDDVEWDQQRLSIWHTVTTSGGRRQERDETKSAAGVRYVPIIDQAIPPLTRLLVHSRELGSDYVAAGSRGGSLNTATWNRRLAGARNAGITVYSAHLWRHLFASMLIASGEPLETVRQALGHASITTTERVYRHALDLSQAALAKRLSASVTKLTAESVNKLGD